jgi:hypothetical protein
MRTSFKRIFRRKSKKKSSDTETADDTTGDEVADSNNRPASLFQPQRQRTIPAGDSTSTVQTSSQSSIARRNSDQLDSTRNSVETASEIAPIEEEVEAQSKNRSALRVATAKMSSKNTESEKDVQAMPPPGEAFPDLANSYESIPFLEQTQLPRGGVSVDTKAVGRVQVRVLVDDAVHHGLSIITLLTLFVLDL